MSRPITESRMASATSFFFLPPNLIRPTAMSTPLKAKRRCCSSFFITDILGHSTGSPSSDSKNPLPTVIDKDCSESIDEDDPMLHDSDDNGKNSSIHPIDFFDQSKI